MQINTTITKVEDVEVEIDPAEVIKKLLTSFKNNLISYYGIKYDRSFIKIKDEKVIQVDVKEGYSYGHYEQEDKHYETDITETIEKHELEILLAYNLILKHLDNNV